MHRKQFLSSWKELQLVMSANKVANDAVGG